jgi:hypothetical protein
MTKAVPFLIQGKNIILVIDGKSHTISKDTHIAYGKIVDALKSQDWDAIRDNVEPKKAIVNFGAGNVSIEGSDVFWKGQPFHNALATRMISMYQEGFPIDPMVRFMENLMDNPSKRSVDQVYGFLEKNSLPITEDGHFLAYKRVKQNYMDCHTGTIDNSIGQVVTMDRNLVDDNPDSHCSTGLHFCSESYLGHFGRDDEPVMILKINPADVVSIPTDYNGAKGRCMRYEVVAEVDGDPATAFAAAVNGDYTPKAKPAPAAPAAAWPFPVADDVAVEDSESTAVWPQPKAWGAPKAAPAKAKKGVQLYDCVRARSGGVEYTGLTLAQAQAQVAKNISQKKVSLRIVKTGTSTPA